MITCFNYLTFELICQAIPGKAEWQFRWFIKWPLILLRNQLFPLESVASFIIPVKFDFCSNPEDMNW